MFAKDKLVTAEGSSDKCPTCGAAPKMEGLLEVAKLRELLDQAAKVLLSFGLNARTWDPLRLEEEIRQVVPRG